MAEVQFPEEIQIDDVEEVLQQNPLNNNGGESVAPPPVADAAAPEENQPEVEVSCFIKLLRDLFRSSFFFASITRVYLRRVGSKIDCIDVQAKCKFDITRLY